MQKSVFAGEICGDGDISVLLQLVGTRTFPVTSAIDAAKIHIDANSAKLGKNGL